MHGFVNPPVHRGSTMLHTDCADRIAFGAKRLEQAEVYGVMGNATHHALEDVIAEVEGGTRCQIVSSGLAAVTTPLLCYLKAGEHCLMPDNVYGPDAELLRWCVAALRRRDDVLRSRGR